MKSLLFAASAALFLTACGISQRTVSPVYTPSAYTVSEYSSYRVSLEQAYRDWRGTPYVLGGRSESGVDCSSFVSIVFDDYFGVQLPMNTRRQMNRGQGVRLQSLRTGDLIFFQTGRRTLHVGIIVEGREFLHASTSQGVTLSNLNDNYWSSRYIGARRVM